MRDDWDQIIISEGFADAVAALYQQELAAAFTEADAEIDLLIYGNGTGVLRGIHSWEDREPTPIERALALLDPELRRCPLYAAGPPAIYPNWKA